MENKKIIEDVELADFWKEMIEIFKITKSLQLKSEELTECRTTFIAPIKEYRDSLTHILKLQEDIILNINSEHARDNMIKAKGHIYRAFFDYADFLCLNYRNEIDKVLRKFSIKRIKKSWKEYESVKEKVFKISEEILSLRDKKKSNIMSKDGYEHLQTYVKYVDELYDIKKFVFLDFLKNV